MRPNLEVHELCLFNIIGRGSAASIVAHDQSLVVPQGGILPTCASGALNSITETPSSSQQASSRPMYSKMAVGQASEEFDRLIHALTCMIDVRAGT